jgi:hypothetical protein
MVAGYETILGNLAADYVGHTLSSLTTQYYQTIAGATTFVSGLPDAVGGNGSQGGTYLDTNPYPASGCKDPATPGNCITDAQLQTELLRVMKLNGWSGGVGKIYALFTSAGEGSCFTPTSTASGCAAPGGYCAYHSHVVVNAVPVIYANIAYGNPSGCLGSGSSPNNIPVADAAATSTSHELTEAITDPLGNAWFSAQGNEIGDLCNATYGTNSYDGGLANQRWNGHYYELQREFDNHLGICINLGP